MRKIQRRDFLKAMGLTTAALGLTACSGSSAASASSVSSAPASSSSAPSASAQPEAAKDKAAPAGPPVTQFQTGELTIGDYTFKAQYIPFDVRREVCGAYHLIKADSYRGNYFFSFYNEDNEEQSAKIFEYAIKDDRLTPVEEYNIDGSDALSIDRNGILYVLETFDVYCYDLNSSDPEEPGDALDYWGRCYSSKDRDLTVLYRTNSAPVLVQDGEYTELSLEGDNEIGPFYSMSSLNLSGDELLTVGELESNGDDYLLGCSIWAASRSAPPMCTPCWTAYRNSRGSSLRTSRQTAGSQRRAAGASCTASLPCARRIRFLSTKNRTPRIPHSWGKNFTAGRAASPFCCCATAAGRTPTPW